MIVCGVDASRVGFHAAVVAARLATALDRPLVLVHAIPPPVTLGVATRAYAHRRQDDPRTVREAGERLLAAAARHAGHGEAAERRVALGDPAAALRDVAARDDADLLVVGTRGRGALAAAILGSVSSAVVSHARCPVVLVPPLAELGGGPVLCAVDATEAADDALLVADVLGARLGRGLRLVHVVAAKAHAGAPSEPAVARRELAHGRRLLAEVAAAHGLGTDVARRVATGTEADAIGREADDARAALVVVGTRRRSALRAALAGSVSMRLRAVSQRPVVTVPSGAGRRFAQRLRIPPADAASAG